MINFKVPRFSLPKHQLEIDETKFLTYLEGSISLKVDEKRNIVNAIPNLSQFQADELMRILQEEKIKFQELSKEHETELNNRVVV